MYIYILFAIIMSSYEQLLLLWAIIWWISKQHSNWEEALKELQTWNFVFGKHDINLNG